MEGKQSDTDISVSAQVPIRVIWLIVSGLLFGGLGLGTFVNHGAETKSVATCSEDAAAARQSAEGAATVAATLARAFEQSERQLGDFSTRLGRAEDQVESLRIDLLTRTALRFTSDDASALINEQDKIHAAHDRAITAIEREIDSMKVRLWTLLR